MWLEKSQLFTSFCLFIDFRNTSQSTLRCAMPRRLDRLLSGAMVLGAYWARAGRFSGPSSVFEAGSKPTAVLDLPRQIHMTLTYSTSWQYPLANRESEMLNTFVAPDFSSESVATLHLVTIDVNPAEDRHADQILNSQKGVPPFAQTALAVLPRPP
jgi:hypothetical protein